jgi:hypothetical protein
MGNRGLVKENILAPIPGRVRDRQFVAHEIFAILGENEQLKKSIHRLWL